MKAVKEELLNVSIARRNNEPISQALNELKEKKAMNKVLNELDRQKMNAGIQFAKFQLMDLIRCFKNGDMSESEFKSNANEVLDCFKNGIQGLANIDKFEVQFAWSNLLKSIKRELV